MIKERFDRLATGSLTATEQYHRDAVWYRLSAGGVGLPSSIIAVASYVLSQGGTAMQKTLEQLGGTSTHIKAEVGKLNDELIKHGASLAQCIGANRPDGIACQAFQKLDALADTGRATIDSVKNFQIFKLCCNLGFSDSADSVSCAAGSTLVLGSLLLVTLWLVATWLPYIDGPRHVTMPRLWFMVACSGAVTIFVGFVNALLLT